jgi:predicted ATP-binding protein involved in virulence
LQLLTRLRQADAAEETLVPFDRWKLFIGAIKELFEDPSMRAIATMPSPRRPADTFNLLAVLFPTLSTGHKAILNIVASLCVHLNANSLVMMDEPEAHLHPPLVASLLKIVRTLLEQFNANAIVATHSPIVIQETLGQHVVRFRRVANRTSWDLHPTQTFGENLATLTRETFGLPAARAHFVSVLRSLIDDGVDSLEEIDALFGDRGMSSPARAQALRLIAGKRTGNNE